MVNAGDFNSGNQVSASEGVIVGMASSIASVGEATKAGRFGKGKPKGAKGVKTGGAGAKTKGGSKAKSGEPCALSRPAILRLWKMVTDGLGVQLRMSERAVNAMRKHTAEGIAKDVAMEALKQKKNNHTICKNHVAAAADHLLPNHGIFAAA